MPRLGCGSMLTACTTETSRSRADSPNQRSILTVSQPILIITAKGRRDCRKCLLAVVDLHKTEASLIDVLIPESNRELKSGWIILRGSYLEGPLRRPPLLGTLH